MREVLKQEEEDRRIHALMKEHAAVLSAIDRLGVEQFRMGNWERVAEGLGLSEDDINSVWHAWRVYCEDM